MASREDLEIEGNTARRLFWEACASRAPLVLGRTEGPPWTYREGSKDVAEWADRMLKEWDRRWISKQEDKQEDLRSDYGGIEP